MVAMAACLGAVLLGYSVPTALPFLSATGEFVSAAGELPELSFKYFVSRPRVQPIPNHLKNTRRRISPGVIVLCVGGDASGLSCNPIHS